MMASISAPKTKTTIRQPLIRAYLSFCLRNNIPMHVIARNVEHLTNELNHSKYLTPYQAERIIIRYIPKEIHDRLHARAIFEGKTIRNLVFS